jgi:hypothetical protein
MRPMCWTSHAIRIISPAGASGAHVPQPDGLRASPADPHAAHPRGQRKGGRHARRRDAQGGGGNRHARYRRAAPFAGRLDRPIEPAETPDMCGRFLNKLPVAEIARIFGPSNPLPNYPARCNIAPTDPVLTVRLDPETTARSLDALRWGLLPHWVKDLQDASRMIDPRAETEMAATMPAFRDAFKARRCIIPASGFYEWLRHEAICLTVRRNHPA